MKKEGQRKTYCVNGYLTRSYEEGVGGRGEEEEEAILFSINLIID